MGKKTTELFTPAPPAARSVPTKPPRHIRVRYLQEYSGRAHYYLDGWPWPVPAWTRRFDGWSVGAVVRLAAGVALAAVAAAIWLLRLLGRTAR